MPSRKVRNMRSRRIQKSRKSRKSIYRKKQKGGKYKSRKLMNLKTKSKKQKGGWIYDNEICEEWDQKKEINKAYNKLSPEERQNILGNPDWYRNDLEYKKTQRDNIKEHHCTPKINYCYFKHEFDKKSKRSRFYDPNPPDAFKDYLKGDTILYIKPTDITEGSLMFYKTNLNKDKLPDTEICRKFRKDPQFERVTRGAANYFKKIWKNMRNTKKKKKHGYTQFNQEPPNIGPNSEFNNTIQFLQDKSNLEPNLEPRNIEKVTSRKARQQGPRVTLNGYNNNYSVVNSVVNNDEV